MNKKDILWGIIFISVVTFLIYPDTQNLFVLVTKAHPYLMGFLKVSILASMGELLALRISTGDYIKPTGFFYRFLIWGFIGISFALVFDLFAIGAAGVMDKGLLPSLDNESLGGKLLYAFFTSTLMNLIFAPTFMAFHRITDTFIELGEGKLGNILKINIGAVTNRIDWNSFIGFVILKTIPFFWIPAHTVTFMLPGEYRVLAAALLSIALGGLLAFSKRKAVNSTLKV